MTSFFKNKVIPFLWEHEGTEYENDSDDPGGETRWGIDKRSHPNLDIKNITESEAMLVYWNEWVNDGCDHLPSPIDWLFFDACVNCGIGRASSFLKDSNRDPKKFQEERRGFYNRLAQSKPRLGKFLKGWIARVDDLSKQVGLV
jgi:lysozyme family protein